MTFIRRTTILALVVAMLAFPTTAFAQDDAPTDRPAATDEPTDSATDRITDHQRGFEAAKERALKVIEAQLRVVESLGSKISESRFITEQHAGMLRGDLARTEAGLEQLERKVEAAENWEELKPLLGQLDDYKVFQVLAPKVHQVIASDALVAGANKLDEFAGKLDDIIARFEEAGFDVDEAKRLLAEMNDLVAKGFRLADPVAENVINLGPEDWPDPAQSILAAGRADLQAAGQSLRGAHRTAMEIVHFLRNLFDGVTDSAITAPTDA